MDENTHSVSSPLVCDPLILIASMKNPPNPPPPLPLDYLEGRSPLPILRRPATDEPVKNNLEILTATDTKISSKQVIPKRPTIVTRRKSTDSPTTPDNNRFNRPPLSPKIRQNLSPTRNKLSPPSSRGRPLTSALRDRRLSASSSSDATTQKQLRGRSTSLNRRISISCDRSSPNSSQPSPTISRRGSEGVGAGGASVRTLSRTRSEGSMVKPSLRPRSLSAARNPSSNSSNSGGSGSSSSSTEARKRSFRKSVST